MPLTDSANRGSSEAMRHIVHAADIDAVDIEEILDRSRRARAGAAETRGGFVVTLIFLSSSTRTRLGFAVAAARLGGNAFVLSETRATGPGLPSESLEDTMRVCSGMSDIIVFRCNESIDTAGLVACARCPVVNGGDAIEHPTQALIDRFAIETMAGPLGDLHIGISGDLTSRSTRSLLGVLAAAPPRQLSLFAPPGRGLINSLPAALANRTDIRVDADFGELDVLVLPGLSPGSGETYLDDGARQRWGFSPKSARVLPKRAIVLSPGPMIDEIHPFCRDDPRLRFFEESDLGTFVRIGVLSWLLDR